MTVHAILIAVQVTQDTNGPSNPMVNATRAIDSAHRCLTGVLAVPEGQIQELRSDHEDVTVAKVTTAFTAISATFTDDDTIIVMFAGHGRQDGNKFLGWALTGTETFSPELLWAQYDHYSHARWIVLSDCCYGAGIAMPMSFARKAFHRVRSLLAKIFRIDDDDRFQTLANSTCEETGSSHRPDKAPASLVAIAAASKDEIVTDQGELLFGTLVVGSSLGGLSYDDLQRSFDLASKQGHAFACTPSPATRGGDPVLT